MKGKIRLAISKVLTLIVFIAPITFSVPNSYSAEYNPISVNEWSYTFDRYAIDYFNPINRGYTHNELKSKIPFYEDILGAWPTSIRFPKQVYLPKDSKETLCYSLPLQIRAEVDLGYLQYSPSPIEIEFWIRIVMQGQTLSFQSPSLIVGPQDWRGSQKIIQKEIPFCLTREIASQNITAIFVRTNLFYSRLFSEFNAPTAECFDHTTKACRYIGLYGLGIEVVQDAYSPVDEGKGFERTISALKETLLSISPFEKQNMEITRRNLTYAENELEAAKARYAKLITELEAKAKAEADAKAQAEAKAKAEADAKAQAEAKAKAEAFAKQVECEKSAGDARTLRNELIQTIAKYPKKSEQLASFLNNSELNSLCPDSLNLALLKTSIELVKLQVSSIRSTITCIKGKLTKKVTAVNPKCPSGYKKK